MSAFSPCCAAKAPNAFWNYRLTSRRQELGERWDTRNTLISERMRTKDFCAGIPYVITHTHTRIAAYKFDSVCVYVRFLASP